MSLCFGLFYDFVDVFHLSGISVTTMLITIIIITMLNKNNSCNKNKLTVRFHYERRNVATIKLFICGRHADTLNKQIIT